MSESQDNATWGGVPIDAPLEISVLHPNREKAIVLASGGLRPEDSKFSSGTGALDLAREIEGVTWLSAARLVYVALAIPGGYLTGLDEAEDLLRRAARRLARRSGAIIGFVDCACGPGLYLSQVIRDVGLLFASPTARLGASVNSGDSIEATALRVGLTMNLGRLNPTVHINEWMKLAAGQIVTGERAEMLDLVGGLKRDVFALAGVDAEVFT